MTTGTQQTNSRRWLLPFLAALIAALAAILGFTTASASAAVGAQTRVGAFNVAGEVLVGPPEHIAAGQRLGSSVAGPGIVVATGVAANAVSPGAIRLSQSSVNGFDEIAASMRANGWVGKPIDVVRMPDGGLTAIDNTRVLAAHQAGIDVQATIRGFDEALPEGMIARLTTPKGGAPSTWGEALLNRIGGQNSGFRNTYPYGSPFTGWGGG